MFNRLPIAALLGLFLITVVGCKTSPFVGQWESVSFQPAEFAEKIDTSRVSLDSDGFVLATAVVEDGEGQYAITGHWDQPTANRIDASFEIDDETFHAHAWLVGPNTLHATVIVDDDGESATAVFKRVSTEAQAE